MEKNDNGMGLLERPISPATDQEVENVILTLKKSRDYFVANGAEFKKIDKIMYYLSSHHLPYKDKYDNLIKFDIKHRTSFDKGLDNL